MCWFMDERFAIAYEKAKNVLNNIRYPLGDMVRTADIIKAVEEITGADVKFADYNFADLETPDGEKGVFAKYGATMCVSIENGKKVAKILLNENETPEMKRFSLVHELGHLVTNTMQKNDEYHISTHINMNITSIPKEFLNEPKYSFLIDEQIANIFALLVLLPYDSLVKALQENDSIEKTARVFGVEKNAVASRLLLEKKERES